MKHTTLWKWLTLLCLCLSLCVSTAFVVAAEGEATPDAQTVLSYAGMSARKNGNSGLRSTYSLDFTAASALVDAGYTVEVGAIMGIARMDGVAYNSIEDLTVVTHATKGYVAEAAKSAAITVWSSADADYATNLFNARNGQSGMFTFTTVYSAAYDTKLYYEIEMCYRGFVALTKNGETTVTYVDATGENFGDEASIYEVVSYFVTGSYDGDDAEELRALPKFHRIMSTVGFDFDATELTGTKAAEALQTASDGTSYREFKKGENNTTGGSVKLTTPSYTVPGIYEVEIDYLTNGAAVASFSFRNNSAKSTNKDFTTTATAGTATFFGLSAEGSVAATIDPTASAVKTVKLTSLLVSGANSITGYLTGSCNESIAIAITGIRLRLVAPFGADTGATYFNLARRNASNTDVYTTMDANTSLAPFSFTVAESGMYRLSGMLGSYNGATWQLAITDGKDTRTLTQSAAGLHAGYGNTTESVVYADGFGDMYLEADTTYTATLTSVSQQTNVYGFILKPVNREANTVIEYYPKDNEAVVDKLLSDGETLLINQTAHTFTVTADRAGIYAVKLKYNAKNARVDYLKLANITVPNAKVSEGRIFENILTYDTVPTDYVVPADDKTGAFLPDLSDPKMNNIYFGEGFLYIYLAEGENSLSLYTAKGSSGTLEFGLCAMQFILLDPLSISDRIKCDAFTREDNNAVYNGAIFPHSNSSMNLKSIETTVTLSAGVYRASGLIQVGPDAKMTLSLLSGENTLGSTSYTFNKSSSYTHAPGTSTGFGYYGFNQEFTVPVSGEYTVKISHSGGTYIAVSELYLTKVSDIPEAIDTPTVTVDSDGVATWDAVKGATAYAYKINDGEAVTTKDTSITLTTIGDRISVMAIGNGKQYLDSAWSDSVTYVKKQFTVDMATDIIESVGLALQTEGTYKDYYLLTANASSNYFDFKINASVAGLYAISFDSMVASGSSARVYIKNTTNKGDCWTNHATTAQISAGKTTVLGTTAAYQYLYEGENTIRMYLENSRAPIYFKTVQLDLYWEDVSDAKLILSSSVVSNIVQSSNGNSGFNTLALLPTGSLMLRGASTTPDAFADIKLPTVSEAGDYTLYFVGAAYQNKGPATVACTNGTTLTYNQASGELSNAYNGSNHYGEGNLYEIGTLSLLNDTDYTITVGASNMWLGIHAIYLVKTGEYSGEKVTLATPTVTVDGDGVASWEPVAGASGYEYTIGSAAPVTTTETSVVLAAGQTITVKALGKGAFADSALSEGVTFVPPAVTEWEFDLSDTTTYTAAGNAAYADGFVYLPAGSANYIEFTVNADKAGFYDVSYIGKAVDRARIHHQNILATADGWSSHRTSAQFAAGSTQSSFTRGTSQYLQKGENKIRIYVFNGSYYASGVKISLIMEDTVDTTHMIVSPSNAVVTKQATGYTDAGFSFNEAPGMVSGAICGRGSCVIDFTLPQVSESGMYTLYVLGASHSTVNTSFALSDGATTLSFTPASLPSHYHEGNLYKIGEMALVAGTDYTLTTTVGGSWFGFHRLILVKTGDVPNDMKVSNVTVDCSTFTVGADALLMGESYNYVTMGAYSKDGNLIRAVYGQKNGLTQTLALSVTLTAAEAANFAFIRLFPTAQANSTTPINEDSVYEYMLENNVTATAYTADKETGEFSVTFNFTSFAHKYVTLLLTDASGNVIDKAYTTLSDYTTNGTTLAITLAPAVAATVSEMKLIVATAEGGTNAVTDMTGFTYRFVGELRFLFVSDLHYTPTFGTQSNSINGIPTETRPQHFVDAILKENATNGVDAVFFLGDLTSSESYYRYFKEGHYVHTNTSSKDLATYDLNKDGKVNMDDYHGSKYDGISELNDKYLSQLRDAGIPVYCVPGNHDTVDNEYWNKIFGYKETFGYRETEYIVRFPEHKTAVIMLNTFDEAKGSQNICRTNDGKTYLTGQQTLGYTPVEQEFLFACLDELTAEGYETVYIASHFFQSDAALVNAGMQYPIIKAYIQGDVHNDNLNNSIGGVPFFSDGHYSQSLMEYKGEYGERIFDIQRLPFSYVVIEKRGDIDKVDFFKTEMVYFGKDNYAFMEKYFTLTEVAAQGENTLILTRITNTVVTDGKTTDTFHAGYYHFEIRTDLSAEDRAIAERIAYLIEEYDLNIFDQRYTTAYDVIPSGMKDTTVTWYKDANGNYKIEGDGRYFCFYYLTSCPNYESFYKSYVGYKTYEIVDGGSATQTFVIAEEVTWTKDK